MNRLFPIVGQQDILERLHRIANRDRYANAYLFHGPEGTGKEALAMEFAALMNCQDSGDRPCGECRGCKQMRHLQHPNLSLIFALPGGKSHDDPLKGLSETVIESLQESILAKSENPYQKLRIKRARDIKISSIRQVQKNLHMGLPEQGRKIVLIFEAERMNTAAFNSILKIVEEPPSHTSFIFCTSALHLIPETIQSRCQLVSFPQLSEDEILNGLSRYVDNTDADTAGRIARMAAGDFGFALALAETSLEEWEAKIIRFFQAVMSGKPLPFREQVEDLQTLSNESAIHLKRFLLLIQLWIRDARLWSEMENPDQLIFRQMVDKIKKFVNRYQSMDYDSAQILLENAVDFIDRNVYIRLALYSLQIQLHQAIHGNLKEKQYGNRHRYNTNRIR